MGPGCLAPRPLPFISEAGGWPHSLLLRETQRISAPPLGLGHVLRGREERSSSRRCLPLFQERAAGRLPSQHSPLLCDFAEVGSWQKGCISEAPGCLFISGSHDLLLLYLISAPGLGDRFHLQHLERIWSGGSVPRALPQDRLRRRQLGLPAPGSTLRLLPPPAQVERRTPRSLVAEGEVAPSAQPGWNGLSPDLALLEMC